MDLLGCPNEILLLIMERVFPDDLVNFVLSCKTIHDHATSRLQMHKKLLDRYSKVEINGDNVDERQSAVPILYAIQQDPLIVYYVHSIQLFPGMESERHPSEGECRQKLDLIAMLSQAPFFRKEPEFLEWKQPVRAGSDGAILNRSSTAFIILLALLPNLERLSLMGDIDQYGDKLQELVATAERWEGEERERPLSRVHSLHVEHWDTEGGQPLQELDTLVYLPSLRKLTGRMLERFDPEDDEEFVPEVPVNLERTSLVTEVDFEWSAISPGRLFEFFMVMPNLDLLEYQHAGAIVGGPPELDIMDYRDELVEIAGDWLKEHGLVAKVIRSADKLKIRRVNEKDEA